MSVLRAIFIFKKYLLKQIVQCLNKLWGVYKVLAPTKKKQPKKPWESNVIGIKLIRDSIKNIKIERLCHVHPLKEKMYINLIEFPFKNILLSTVSTTYINPTQKKTKFQRIFVTPLDPTSFVKSATFRSPCSLRLGARNPWPNQCLWAAKPQKNKQIRKSENPKLGVSLKIIPSENAFVPPWKINMTEWKITMFNKNLHLHGPFSMLVFRGWGIFPEVRDHFKRTGSSGPTIHYLRDYGNIVFLLIELLRPLYFPGVFFDTLCLEKWKPSNL